MRGGGARAPPGERPASLGSTSSAEATMEAELLRNMKEIEEESKGTRRADAGQGSSSSALAPSASRFWRGAPQAAKKVLRVGMNSFPSSPMSGGRTLHEQSTVSHVASTSEPVPLVAARTGTGGAASSEKQLLSHTRPESAALKQSALPDGAAADTQGETAFAETGHAMTGLMDLSPKNVELPKLPHDSADPLHGGVMDDPVIMASGYADPLHGGVMDDPVIMASGYSVHQSYQKNLLPSSVTAYILSPPLVPPSEVQKISGDSGPEIGRMEMLRDPSKSEDAVVRKETDTAILALSTEEEANSSAVDYDVPGRLLECFVVTEEGMAGLIDPSDEKMEPPRLSSDIAKKCPYGDSFNQSYEQGLISQRSNCWPNEVPVKWSHNDDDGIPYPLYAEFCGDTSASPQRREWNDVRIVRKLRGLRQQEKIAARNHFRELYDSWRTTCRKAASLFKLAVENLRHEKPKEDHKEGCNIPEYLVCPLSGKLMVDPVTIATGKTFERRFLKSWFDKNGHICPLTAEMISGTILRNERVRGYLHEWEEAHAEWLRNCRKERK